jgi:hypothetical protein
MKDQGYRSFIPSVFKDGFLQKEWDAAIAKNLQRVEKLKPNETVHMFLDQMKQWKAYGCQFFKCSSSNDSRFPSGCIIAIGFEGVKFIDKTSRKIIENLAYDNIMNFRYDEKEFVLRAGNNLGSKTLLRFETRQGFVIADLINSYIEILAASMTGGSNAVNLFI